MMQLIFIRNLLITNLLICYAEKQQIPFDDIEKFSKSSCFFTFIQLEMFVFRLV